MELIGFKLNKNALLQALYKKNMSMSDLQKKAKVSSSTISRALRLNRPVRTTTANRVAKALGIDVLELLKTETDEKGA